MNTITGRAAFVRLLEDEGITHLFGNPGTTELPIMAALAEGSSLSYVLGLQESLVVAMADGYARASGKLAACNVHVAPGLGNAMGSLYNAKWIGSPVIVTAGQQEQGHGLTEPLLYDPLVPIAAPLVKWAVEVTRIQDLPRIVHRAAKIALTPPTGPVFISLPGDILNDEAELDLGKSTRVDTRVRPAQATLEQLAARLRAAKRPVIISGHEVATSDALDEAARLAEVLGAPVYQQTVPHGAHFYSEHPHFMGALSRDQKQVRAALAPFDLVFCLGADVLRMSVYSPVDPLPDGMPIVQIGLRDWEMGKNYPAEIALRCELKETLRALLPILEVVRDTDRTSASANGPAAGNWQARRQQLREKTIAAPTQTPIDPALLMLRVVEALPTNAVVVDEGILSTRTLHDFLPFRDPRCFFGLASGGIGFALPGAIGIQLAQPDRPVVAIIGDGSAMYSIQALWTAAHLKLPITYVICNNASYRIIKERLRAFHGSNQFIGMDFNDPPIDFVALAESMGVKACRITDAEEISTAVREATASGLPRLLDVVVDDGFSTPRA
ncbi:MAG TPA: thiamine pyrophosphate-binding protein [Gammaproteobacteria bacterium]